MSRGNAVAEEGGDTVAQKDQPQPEEKPLMRGWLHAVAFFVSIPAGIVLVLSAGSTAARIAAAVYSLSLAGLFGASAAYHTLPWSDLGRRRMKRLDHSMIYILIAGTYTPFALLVVRGTWGIVLLSVIWAGAVAGIVLKLIQVDGFQVLAGTLYIVLGWLALLALPKLIHELNAVELALILTGAVIYTLGAVGLLRRKPDPNPKVFGYHEVWHVAVIAACACFYVATFLVVMSR